MRASAILAAVLLCGVLLAAGPAKEHRGAIRVPMWLDAGPDAGMALAPKDLTAALAGAPARVISVSRPGEALMLLVVLDLTDDLELADTARQALIAKIEDLPARTWVGLLGAQDGLRVLLDPTRDQAALAGAIRGITVSGKAGLLETVETTQGIADAILSKSEVRVAILYVTDSDVGNYREDFTNPVINYSDSHDLSRRFPEQLVQEKVAKMENNLAAGQAPVFVVHLRYRSDRLNEAYQVGLKRLTNVTGGSAVFCRSIVEIPDAIQKTIATIESHYSVGLELPQKSAKTLAVQLGLAGAGNSGRNLTYRTRYVFK